MERSSPLAAMQPPSLPGAWGRQHNPINANFLRPRQCEPTSFNFRDLSMYKKEKDYFSFNPVRGSSPTASLAADLSQNFHIDQSPQLPTPRRSLFTASNLQELNSSRDNAITPPVPSSSPGVDTDPMDVSPLPHKPPFLRIDTVLPTPDIIETSLDDAGPISSAAGAISPLTALPTRQSPPRPRRISNASRPSLQRKGHSTTAVPTPPVRSNSAVPNLEQPFRFGNTSRTSLASKPLLETFAESPPSERKLPPSSSNPSLIVSAPLPQLAFPPSNGSPVGPIRRPPGTKRPGALSRRTQSMQCSNPFRSTFRAEKRCCTTGSISLSREDEAPSPYKPKLPNFKKEDEPDTLPRITGETLVKIQDGIYDSELQGGVTVIDCRFEYEYEGGHIDGAVNFNDKEQLASHLFATSPSIQSAPVYPTYDMTVFPTTNDIPAPHSAHPSTSSSSFDEKPPPVIILHCEYSAHRAPLMAKFLRERDRAYNVHRYPVLTYPEIYILDGGYSAFFKAHEERCFPRRYVRMEAEGHQAACESGMAKVRRRGKLARAQTYAFGQGQGQAGLGFGMDANIPTLHHSNSNVSVSTLNQSVKFENLPCAPTSSSDAFMAMDIDIGFRQPETAGTTMYQAPFISIPHRIPARRVDTY